MITEDYVSFETAKLLRDKWFNKICYLGYNKNGEYVPTSNRTNSQIIQPDFCFICCPTLQMAMKWFREVHNIHISITFGWVSGYNAQVDWAEESEKGNDKPACCVWRTDLNTTYEVACEAAIKHCLENLI